MTDAEFRQLYNEVFADSPLEVLDHYTKRLEEMDKTITQLEANQIAGQCETCQSADYMGKFGGHCREWGGVTNADGYCHKWESNR